MDVLQTASLLVFFDRFGDNAYSVAEGPEDELLKGVKKFRCLPAYSRKHKGLTLLRQFPVALSLYLGCV